MNKTTQALMPIALLGAFGLTSGAQTPKSYQAKYTATAPKIDGVVTAGEWDAAILGDKWGVLRLAETDQDKENARFRILWDNQFLYLLFQSDYKTWSEGIGNDPNDNVPGTQNQGINFSADNLNIYIDPNTDAEENQRPDGEVDGYQLAWNQLQGTGSLLNGKFINTGLFLEGHVNTPFGNQAKWQGLRKSSFVQVHGNTGGVVELALSWEDVDAGNQRGAEWTDALQEFIDAGDPDLPHPFPEDGSLWHPFSPKNGDKWIFNISRITTDAANFLPIWSWHGAQGFAVAPHGTLEFIGRPETTPVTWYPINTVTVDTPEPPFDTYLGENLIQGPGEGYDAAAPYDQLGGGGTHRWVTVACGFPCDYLVDRPTPKLIFDLGQDRTLGSVDLWGYAATNANGVKKLKLRFATTVDGATGFAKSISYSPTYELPNDDVNRMPRVFTQKVKARYVEIECLDNYFVEPGGPITHGVLRPGGDRVGLGEVAFPVTADDAPAAPVLVARYTFDGDAKDSSGNALDGTVTGATYSDDVPAGLTGKSLQFKSAADFVQIAHNAKLDITNAVTIAAWVKPVGNVAWDGILAKNPSDGSLTNHAGNYELRIENGTRKPTFHYQRGAANDTQAVASPGAATVPADVWSHLAATVVKGGEVIFYLNGTEIGRAPILGTFGVANTSPLFIGSRNDKFTNMDGLLDQVELYNGALSADAIKKLATLPAVVKSVVPLDFGKSVDGFQDDFTGATRNAAWVASPPDKDEYVQGNGVLKVTVVGEGAFDTHLLYQAAYSDNAQEVLARIRVTNFGQGDAARCGIALGVDVDTSQGINLHFRDHNQDGIDGRQFKILDDRRAWGPGFDLKWTDNTWYWVRLKQTSDSMENGDNIFAKFWLADGVAAEPADWQLTWGRDGRVGLAGLVGSSIDGVSEYEVDYILIKATGLPKITPAASAFGGGGTVVETPRPNLISQTRYGAGAFGVTLQTTAGAKYDLEYSQDLKTWTVINPDVPGSGNPLPADETNAERKARKSGFYRVRVK